MGVFYGFILVLLMFCERWNSIFRRVIGHVAFNDFHVCEFCFLSVLLRFECFESVCNSAMLILAGLFKTKPAKLI